MKKMMAKIMILFMAAAGLCVSVSAKEQSTLTDDIFTYKISDKCAIITNIEDTQSVVTIPDKLGGYPVTSIDAGACGGSNTISEIVIPDSVMSIGTMCFAYSPSLKSIKLPSGLKTIGDGAFYQCENLWTINIPNGTISIGDNAFALCSSLTAVTIPSSVKQIGLSAFNRVPYLRIYAAYGSVAQTYSYDNGIGYEELIHVNVNGNEIIFDQPCITNTETYHTLVPMRAVLESLDGKVKWDNTLNMARIDILGSRLLIRPGEPFMMLNNNVYYLSSPAIEFNNRVMFPIRDVLQALGGKVNWDEEKKVITVTI